MKDCLYRKENEVERCIALRHCTKTPGFLKALRKKSAPYPFFQVTMDDNSTFFESDIQDVDLWANSSSEANASSLQKFNCHQNEQYFIENKTEWSLVCNQSLCKPQEYYTTNYGLIGTLFQSIVFLVGVLGNILVCTVVIKTRSMRTTTNCYLVSLAVADTITLVSSVPQEVLSYHILGDQWVWGSVGCTLMIYLQVRKVEYHLTH